VIDNKSQPVSRGIYMLAESVRGRVAAQEIWWRIRSRRTTVSPKIFILMKEIAKYVSLKTVLNKDKVDLFRWAIV